MVEIADDPGATGLSLAHRGKTDFPNTARAHNFVARLGMTGKSRDELCKFLFTQELLVRDLSA